MTEVEREEKKLLSLAKKATILIESLNPRLEDQYGREGLYNYQMQLVKTTEQMAIESRKLPVLYGFGNRTEIYEGEAEENIQFESLQDNIEKITLPRLLPARHETRIGKKYLQAMYTPTIHNHYRSMNKKLNEPAVICFVHLYSDKKKGFRDHDNIETKFIQDIITPFFVKDDNPKYLSNYEMSMASDRNETEIYIVPISVFPDFLKERLRNEEKICG